MAALTGLSGIAGYQVQVNEDAQATPEQRSGDYANPKHGNVGEAAPPYLWNSQVVMAGGKQGPYGPQNQLLGDAEWIWEEAGSPSDDPYFDRTPSDGNAAPFPKGNLSGPTPSDGPDDIARQLQQSYAIHSINTGASLRAQTTMFDPLNDEWQGFDQENPGYSELTDVPAQMKSAGYGWGTTDRTQSFARQNGFGFDSAHQQRRWAAGEIPGNNMWMRPGGRVMQKSMAGPARPPIGPSSPFAGQDLGTTFAVGGAILMDSPTEYVAPPQPYLAQPAINIGQVDDYGAPEWY